MEFENPLALWGLLGLSLPVIIHLVSLQKAKKIYFSSTQLLRQLTVESSAKRKIKEWLILASRILALFFLILAFSMPFWTTDGQWNSEQEGLAFQVYIDNSYSMERNPGQGTLFDQALMGIQALAKTNSASTRYQYLDNDFLSSDMLSISSELLSKRVTQQQFSFRSRSLHSVVERFAHADQLGKKNKHCFIFSDFQKSTIGQLKTSWDSTTQYYLIPVQNTSQGNVFIDSVWFDKPVVKKGDRLKIFYKAFNTGSEEVREQLVKLQMNDKQASVSYVDIPALSSKEGYFEYMVTEGGDLKGKITFDDGDLSFDNSFYFTLTANHAVRVASISDLPNAPQSLVFKDSEDFVLQSYSSNTLNYAQLDEADFIIIEGLSQQSTALMKRVGTWLNAGKSILFIPSALDRTLPSELTDALMIPAVSLKTDSVKATETAVLEFPDLNNPFFADIFEDKKSTMSMPFAQASMALPPGYSSLLTTVMGESVFSRSSQGSTYKGIAYWFHFPLQKSHTNFPQHSFFVPLLLKMALLSKENNEGTYFRQGVDMIQLSVNEDIESGLVEIRNDKNEVVIPSQRFNGSLFRFDLPEQIKSPGFYELVYKGKSLRTFALNTGREESLTASYSAPELMEHMKAYPRVNVLENVSEVALEDQLKELTKGVPLWKYCLILSLVFFLIEIVLIRWFK